MNPVTSAAGSTSETSGGLSGSPDEERRRRSGRRDGGALWRARHGWRRPRLLLDRLDAAGEQAQRETQQAQTCTRW